jgi:plasmid stabilization system protein ParE
VRVSLAPEAERDLVEGGLYYTREANEELGRAFVTEFERAAALLVEQPGLGAA